MSQQRDSEKVNMLAFSVLMIFVFLAAYQIYCVYRYDANKHLGTRSSQARNLFELLKKP